MSLVLSLGFSNRLAIQKQKLDNHLMYLLRRTDLLCVTHNVGDNFVNLIRKDRAPLKLLLRKLLQMKLKFAELQGNYCFSNHAVYYSYSEHDSFTVHIQEIQLSRL